MWLSILTLTSIGFGCGVMILVVSRVLPPEPESFRKIQEVSEHLPGLNCGACGEAGCFAYAQALALDKDHFTASPCPGVLQDEEMLAALQLALGISIDASSMSKKAFVACAGDNEIIGIYNGLNSCKSAAILLGGYQQCPFGCFGLNDCGAACPENAITISADRHVAQVNWTKCTGCGLCTIECPHNLIKLISPDTKIALACSYEPMKDISSRGKCDRGCLHCRKCERACDYGAIEWDKDKGWPIFNSETCVLCGACLEVCPNFSLPVLTSEPLHPEFKKEKAAPKSKVEQAA